MFAEEEILLQLRSCAYAFGSGSAAAKKECLIKASGIDFKKTRVILKYHDMLLFLLAYPEDEQQYKLALHEMFRLADIVKNLPPPKKGKLDLSGLAFTSTHGGFSISLIKWLLKEFPGQARIHSFDKEGIHPKEVLKHALPEAEFEIASDEKSNQMSWVTKTSGTKNRHKQLAWLLEHLQRCNTSAPILDQLFEALKL